MSRVKRVSASQVQDFAKCERKWYINSVLKERGPETDAQKKGTEVHAAIEKYLPTGKIDPGPWAEHVALSAPFLPPTPIKPSVYVEKWIEMPTYKGGPLWVGKIDILNATDQVIEILDHKTSKTNKYKLKAEELKESPQMAAYGYYALTEAAFQKKDRTQVKLTHNNIRIYDKPKVVQVSTFANKAEIFVTHNRSLQLVERMTIVGDALSWKDVTPNVKACGDYGGCPYREKCGFTTDIEILKGVNGMSTSLLDRLKSKNQVQPIVAEGIIPPDAPSRETVVETALIAEPAEPSAPKKSKKKATEATDAPEPLPEATVAIPMFTLYVDCLPMGQEVTVFEKIVGPLAVKVADDSGVADLRFLKYGEGKARLAVLIREALPTFPSKIHVTSMATFADTFMEIAVDHASAYIRATRG